VGRAIVRAATVTATRVTVMAPWYQAREAPVEKTVTAQVPAVIQSATATVTAAQPIREGAPQETVMATPIPCAVAMARIAVSVAVAIPVLCAGADSTQLVKRAAAKAKPAAQATLEAAAVAA
jgi:hypothetical protein